MFSKDRDPSFPDSVCYRSEPNRRDFISLGTAALAFPLLFGCRSNMLAQKAGDDRLHSILRNAITGSGCNWCGAKDAPANVSSKTTLAGPGDRGEPLLVAGTVYHADGTTPAPNTLIYLYHTDVNGYYGRGNEPPHGRFRGWLLTDENGGYVFRTIKPAPYPELRFAAHIHMTVTTETRREDWIDSILFDGDQLISANERRDAGNRGGFDPILKLERRPDGLLVGRRDIKLM